MGLTKEIVHRQELRTESSFLVRDVHFVMWLIFRTRDLTPYPKLGAIDLSLIVIGVLFLGTAYLLVCVAWYPSSFASFHPLHFCLVNFRQSDLSIRFDLLLRAKKLGDKSKRVRILRKVLIFTVSITTPIGFVAQVIGAAGFYSTFTSVVGAAFSGIAVMISLVITTYFLVVVEKWANDLIGKSTSSKRLMTVRRKNKWLIFANLSLVFALAVIVIFQFVPKGLPLVMLCANSMFILTSRLVRSNLILYQTWKE